MLAGRVHDAEGRPVPGARLYLEVRGTGPALPGSYAARAVTAAADGTFRIGNLMPGRLERFVVEVPGYVVRKDALPNVLLEAGRVRQVSVLLERGGTIEGTVRGPDGTPVANAWVEAESVPVDVNRFGRWTESTSEELGATQADARGRYRLDGLKPVPGTLRASAPGFYAVGEDGRNGALPYTLESAGELRTVDLELKATVALEGIVVDGAGDPVAGAHVQAKAPPPLSFPRRDHTLPATDRAGRFVVEGLVPGRTWSLWAFSDLGRTEKVEVELAEDEEPAPVRLSWRAGGVIAGRVITEPRPSDVPARVRCANRPHYNRAVRVADDGSFRFEGLDAGTYMLAVVDYNLDEELERIEVQVGWGEVVQDVILHARPMGEIAGVVVDAEGEPQAGVAVEIRAAAEDGGDSKRENTRQGGRFLFSCVPDVRYTLYLDRQAQPGHVRVRQIDLRYVRPARPEVRLEGRVLGPDGQAVAEAVLRLTQHETGQRTTEVFPVLDGHFLAVFRRRGTRLDIRVAGARGKDGKSLGARPYVQESVDVGAGALEIRLEPGLVISGDVAGPSPVGAAGVALTLHDVDQDGDPVWMHDRHETRVDADAGFTFAGLAPGRYAVVVTRSPEGWIAPPGIAAEAGDRHVVVTLSAARSVTGHVVGPDGAPVVNASVHFAWVWPGGTHASRMTRTGAEGRFEVKRLPDGVTGRVSVRPLAVEPPLLGAAKEEVEAGATEVAFQLALGALIQGRVTDEQGRALEWASIVARPVEGAPAPAGQQYYAQVPRDTTRFAIGPLPAGRYRLFVAPHPDFDPGPPRTVDAPAEGVQIVLRRR